jgi:hypothetical protein
VVKKSPPSILLWRGFLLPSVHGVAPHLLPKDGMEGVPSLLGSCITPTAKKGVDVMVNSLTQSQKLPGRFWSVWRDCCTGSR